MFLLILLLLSCAGIKTPVSNQAGSVFVTSGSPCLDSVLVNIEHAGCKNMTSSTRGGTLKLACVDEVTEGSAISPWIAFDFHVVFSRHNRINQSCLISRYIMIYRDISAAPAATPSRPHSA